MYRRALDLALIDEESCFLWGARQTGKSTFLRERYPDAHYYDLLKSDQYRRLINEPSLLREELTALNVSADTQITPVIIDEVQKIPELLDEIHWLMENRGVRFVLCGSSARKLRRGHANLLGGRAIRYELYPLTYGEVPQFDLIRALNRGLLPRMYDSAHYPRLLQSYVSDYLREEIAAEALTRNVPGFSRFLDVAALSNGEVISYQNIASECGVSAPTVKEYFQILEDTLVGTAVPAFRKKAKRRVILSPKFFLLDVGLVGFLCKRGKIEYGSSTFGRAFEHFIFMELRASSSYSEEFYPINYWRTASGFEVDFILGSGELAIEVKSSRQVNYRHLKGIRAFAEEHAPRRCIVVSCDRAPRKTEDGIEILPWQHFLQILSEGL